MAKFIKSSTDETNWIHDTKKEICFVGRSNVGKSTLINTLANEKIAKTSNTPGRTQLVNFFDFGKFRIIDLPGYGFAKVNKNIKKDLDNRIWEYLKKRVNLCAVFQICDSSVITEKDVEMSDFLSNNFSNHYVLLNKTDKQNKSFFDNNWKKISSYLNVEKERLIPISSKNKMNINYLKQLIETIVKDS